MLILNKSNISIVFYLIYSTHDITTYTKITAMLGKSAMHVGMLEKYIYTAFYCLE